MAIMHKTNGSMKGMGSSATVHKEVGSGSRPTMSKHKIMTSAPMHPHHLDRKPPRPLK